MKRHKRPGHHHHHNNKTLKKSLKVGKSSSSSSSSSASSNVNEMLKICLARVCELQQELNRQSDYEEDPQAAGYAACAIETIKFLQREGLDDDHPMMKTLVEKFMPSE